MKITEYFNTHLFRIIFYKNIITTVLKYYKPSFIVFTVALCAHIFLF